MYGLLPSGLNRSYGSFGSISTPRSKKRTHFKVSVVQLGEPNILPKFSLFYIRFHFSWRVFTSKKRDFPIEDVSPANFSQVIFFVKVYLFSSPSQMCNVSHPVSRRQSSCLNFPNPHSVASKEKQLLNCHFYIVIFETSPRRAAVARETTQTRGSSGRSPSGYPRPPFLYSAKENTL